MVIEDKTSGHIHKINYHRKEIRLLGNPESQN